ncbi:MAG: hypothetical protein RLZZ618_1184 [Pseudomonadota bacterium]|jgi:predicted DCC family thiol-disulfide oxidoreductase YuxK
MSDSSTPTVYYNSACPVCNAGVCSMRERLADDAMHWVDVHEHPEVLEPLGLELEDVRERLHVVGRDGAMVQGFDALVEAWSHLPRWGWTATPLRWRAVRPLGRLLYNAFARQLFRWNRRRGHW